MGWMNVGLGTSYGTSHWFFGAVGNGGMIINSYYMSGWWFEPLRKNINQLGWLFPIYEKIKKNVPNHQPVINFYYASFPHSLRLGPGRHLETTAFDPWWARGQQLAAGPRRLGPRRLAPGPP